MRIIAAAVLIIISTSAVADEVKGSTGSPAPATKPVCTPPDELVVKLPFPQAVTLNNILQDADVGHKEWVEVATNVRAQLVGQCKENKK